MAEAPLTAACTVTGPADFTSTRAGPRDAETRKPSIALSATWTLAQAFLLLGYVYCVALYTS